MARKPLPTPINFPEGDATQYEIEYFKIVQLNGTPRAEISVIHLNLLNQEIKRQLIISTDIGLLAGQVARVEGFLRLQGVIN